MAKCNWVSLVVLLIAGCGKPLPSFDHVNLKAWKEDKNGCKYLRMTMDSSLVAQKQKLLALDEKQIIALLGKPDQNELYKRNQKFYRYFISPAAACGDSTGVSKALTIRFNAVGLAKEISIE